MTTPQTIVESPNRIRFCTRTMMLVRTLLATTALVALAGCAAAAQTVGSTSAAAQTQASSVEIPNYPLHELRTYTTNEGKLDALHARFRDHTMALFEKHGAKNIAYWTPRDKPNTLIYIIAHASEAAREATWKSFLEDPQWQAAYADSIADGRLVANIDSVLMRATDYSPNR